MTGPPPAIAAVRLAVRRQLVELAGDHPGALVLVACSGGADSLALVAAAGFEGPKLGLKVGAITIDHGLQAGSADRAAHLVGELSPRLNGPVECVRVEVGAVGGPEAAARMARYAALNEAASRLGAVAVLLGHSLDDQAETVLLGLARGSGARSLAAMAPVVGLYHRPLLGLSRETLRAACLAEPLLPWDDPHNLDATFARVRVRTDALPVLERVLGPGVAAALARTADLLRQDADALDGYAAAALVAASAASAASTDASGLSVDALAEYPAAVRTRVLRSAALAAGSPAGALNAGHVRALDALITDWHGQGPIDLPGGVAASRSCDRVLFAGRPQ